MVNIFISYRREDSSGHAGRLCDRLNERFGDRHVFMDLQDIAPGQDFAQSIDERIAGCDCVVAVIGPRWLEIIRERAASGEDFVQHEIAAALRRRVRVIPVLVGGARMPAAEQLPSSMSELRYRNAFEVRDERFDEDVALLSEAIDGQLRHGGGRKRAVFVGAAIIAILAAAIYSWQRPPQGIATASAVEAATVAPVAVPARPALGGDWVADMRKDGQPPFRIRLTFIETGDNLAGMVRYPTGDAPILDARVAGNSLTFHTSHIPQFESTPAIIRFQAEMADDRIRLTVTDDNGVATGFATRQPAAGQ